MTPMHKKLELLIPHYKELPSGMEPMLRSLELQRGIDFNDFGVIIVFDGEESNPLPEQAWKDYYPFDIEFIHMPHKGLSAARNKAFDCSTADWVMFCDADDMFCSAMAIYIIMAEMEKGFDVLIDCFLEELKRAGTGNMIYIPHERDFTFVHGKVYKRQHLLDKKVRFDERLTLCEDSNFNLIATNYTQNVGYCPTPYYLWCWRDGSTTRNDIGYYINAYPQFMDANTYTIERFLADGNPALAHFHVCAMIVDLYFLMNGGHWLEPQYAESRMKVGVRFKEYLKNFEDIWTTLDDDDITKLSTDKRYKTLKEEPNAKQIILTWCENILDRT